MSDGNIIKYIEDFLYYEGIGLGKSDNTIKSYSEDLHQFSEYLKENEEVLEVGKITNFSIRSFMAFLNGHDISKRSINRKLSAVRTFYKYLLRQKVIDKNYSKMVASPKFEKKLPSVLNKVEVKKITEIIKTDNILGIRDRAIVELLYSSGIRAGELISLSEYQFDFEAREIRVIGKGDRERITFFSNTAKEWIIRYINEKKYSLKNYSKEAVFVNNRGGVLTDRSLRRLIENHSKEAGIEKEVTPHTFRHTFATYMLDKGMDIRAVQELLGHASITTTQVYTHVSKELLREIYMNTHPFA